MLVLQRRVGQSIAIGEDMEIVVTKIKGKAVSLGIFAPRSVTVDRGEIHLRRKLEQAVAAGSELTTPTATRAPAPCG